MLGEDVWSVIPVGEVEVKGQGSVQEDTHDVFLQIWQTVSSWSSCSFIVMLQHTKIL